jgi:hypothetical protein
VRVLEHEATAANLMGVFTGLAGHGVAQIEVTHGFSISWKVGK